MSLSFSIESKLIHTHPFDVRTLCVLSHTKRAKSLHRYGLLDAPQSLIFLTSPFFRPAHRPWWTWLLLLALTALRRKPSAYGTGTTSTRPILRHIGRSIRTGFLYVRSRGWIPRWSPFFQKIWLWRGGSGFHLLVESGLEVLSLMRNDLYVTRE